MIKHLPAPPLFVVCPFNLFLTVHALLNLPIDKSRRVRRPHQLAQAIGFLECEIYASLFL
jgi:hypothetical protein